MEIVGSFLDEEWESLSQLFSSGENPDFLLHCDSSSLFSSNVDIPSATFSPSDHALEANFCSISQESSNTTSEIDEALFLNIHGNEDRHHDQQLFNADMNFHNDGFMLPSDLVMEEFLCLKGENRPLETADSCQLKRELEDSSSPQNPKKKPRNAQKSRTTQSKKSKRTKHIEEERNSCSSEEDSNASQELINGGTTSESNAKTRANRGSATDPQSLYARKRRERINERLKILQNLVPNGTKVDISTMLEEAVQYVKFLQLQIKLLSSDNMWMYAPLAYNGMDLSIYQNISPN